MSVTALRNPLPKNLLKVIELIGITTYTALSLTVIQIQSFTELKKIQSII